MKPTTVDIFDLSNLEGLPISCLNELKPSRLSEDTKQLLDLFKHKSRLSFDEIIVGLYRLHKVEKTRTWVNSTLYNLSKKENLIRKVKGSKGEYEKCW